MTKHEFNSKRNATAASVLGVVFLLVIGGASSGCFSGLPLPIDLYLVLFMVAFLVYGLLMRFVLRGQLSTGTLQWLMVVAILARGVTLLGPHRHNSDVWRYLWDGHVLASGYNPYQFTPDDPALDGIRDRSIYENLNPAFNHIRTVYGPVATAVFSVCSQIPGDGAAIIRATMVVGDLSTIFLLTLLLRQLRIPDSWALVYALNPLTVDSFAGRGQMDALLLPLFVLTVLFLVKQRFTLAGSALAAAVLVKVVAIVVIPVFLLVCWEKKWTGIVRGLGGLLVVGLIGCLPLLLVGFSSAGGLAIYASQWRTNASVFAAVESFAGTTAANVIAVVALTSIIAVTLRSSRDLRVVACQFGVVLLAVPLLAPAVFPWYLTWALPFAPMLIRLPRWHWFGWSLICWSGTVMLWYLRFLVYPPIDDACWPLLAANLRSLSSLQSEPWRVVEYGPVVFLFVVGVLNLLLPDRSSGHFSIADESIQEEPLLKVNCFTFSQGTAGR